MTLRLPNLEIDRDGDGPDDEVMLTQDFGGDTSMVTLHPIQVRLLAERMGLLVPNMAAERTIARLSRQLRVLTDRISKLDDDLNFLAEHGHEGLEDEIAFTFASWQLANEFCNDLPPLPDTAPAGAPAPPQQPDQPDPQPELALKENAS